MDNNTALNKALVDACKRGDLYSVIMTRGMGADPVAEDCEALMMATMHNHWNVVQYLLDGMFYTDPSCQWHVRFCGTMCTDSRIREALVAFNKTAIKEYKWDIEQVNRHWSEQSLI